MSAEKFRLELRQFVAKTIEDGVDGSSRPSPNVENLSLNSKQKFEVAAKTYRILKTTTLFVAWICLVCIRK